jgi:hypothetical protein
MGNWWYGHMGYGGMMGYGQGIVSWWPVLMLLALWSVFWKGLALWHSAQRGKPWWFLACLVLNTAGILEIVYLFGFAKLKFQDLFTSKK